MAHIIFTRSPSTEGDRVYKLKICLSVSLSSLQNLEYRYRPFISSQDHARHHISYIAGQRMMSAVIWRCQTQWHRQRQIQSASKAQCMLYFWRAGGSRISNMIWTWTCRTWSWWTWTWWTQRQIQRHRQRQIRSASKTQCMLYFWRSVGSRISNMTWTMDMDM